MVARMSPLECDLEHLARTGRFILHRAPSTNPYSSRIGYFICDRNDTVLYPPQTEGLSRGATAVEAYEWLQPRP